MQVLVADGDVPRGRRIAEACTERGLSCGVTTHGGSALESALSELPGVLVSQLDLPLIDGPRLASILHANPRTRSTRVLFVSDRGGDAPGADAGAQVIPAPVDPDVVAGLVQAVLTGVEPSERPATLTGVEPSERPATLSGIEPSERPATLTGIEPSERPATQTPSHERMEGDLATLPLGELLQLLHAGRKSGVLELERPGDRPVQRRRGTICLCDGEVTAASTGVVGAEKALYRMLAWDGGRFAFEPGATGGEMQIRRPTPALLREGQRQIREWGRLAVDLPPISAEAVLKVPRSALPSVIHPLTQEVLMVLDMTSRVGDVVDRCSFPDYQVLRTLRTLVDRDLVELRSPADPEARADEPLLTPAREARLREWLGVDRPGGFAPRGATLIVTASDAVALRSFAELLARLPEVVLSEPAAAGAVGVDDLAPLARLGAADGLSVELVHVPATESFAPLWSLAGAGALGTLFVVAGDPARAAGSVRAASRSARTRVHARVFHAALLGSGAPDAEGLLREALELADREGVAVIPVEDPAVAATRLHQLLARILP
jgi:hypothetical protein